MHRIPNQANWPEKHTNKISKADAYSKLVEIPDECIALIVTSPPYWNIVDYEVEGQIGQSSYEEYLADMLKVWKEAYRVLIPNGKIAIVTPIMPIPKEVMPDQHTRHLKNISSDIEHSILDNIEGLHRYSMFIWQKQTSVKMFGSYPYPPNLFEDNTIEFINVMVKDGPPPSISKEIKEASKITKEEWRNLTMQVWPIYPEDVKRAGHPAPFPVVLPQRLIMMYTFKAVPEMGFAGDIVLDMFNGSGSTCIAARLTNRNWIGCDINPEYCKTAENRLKYEPGDPYGILLERVRVKGATNSRQLNMFEDSK